LKTVDLSKSKNLSGFVIAEEDPAYFNKYVTTVDVLYLPGNVSHFDYYMQMVPDTVTVYVGGALYRQGVRPSPTSAPTKAVQPTVAPTNTATVTTAPTEASKPTTAPKATVTVAPTKGAKTTAVPTKGAKTTAVPTGAKNKKTTAVPTTASGATVTPEAASDPETTSASVTTSAAIKTKKDVTVKGFVYTINSDKTLTVEGCKNAKAKVSIPATVKIKKTKYKVTKIAAKAFKNNKKLKQITIGKNITTIGKEAFRGCSNLKTITVKSKVLKKVGKNAFKGISKKAVVTVPKAKQKKLFGKLKTKVKK
jgi:hypothetical protein